MNTALAPFFSSLYKRGRQRVIDRRYALQDKEHRHRDLEEVVEIGDKKLKALPRWTYSFPIPDGIGVRFHDLHFPSPLTLAAFKDDLEIIDIWMQLGFGGACIKTVMQEPRKGNKRPRLQEVTVDGHSCLLNAMGLPGDGVEEKVKDITHAKIWGHGRPIGISIGGSSMQEYKDVFDRLNRSLQVVEDAQFRFATMRAVAGNQPRPQKKPLPYYFEVNISCPNTPEGQQMTKHPELLEELVQYMRTKTPRVIGVKLSPDTPDQELLRFAEMLMAHEQTYVNLGNTTFRKCADVGLPPNAITIGGGGLSGPALYERTLDMIRKVAPTGIAICATGGIDSAEKVLALQRVAGQYEVPLIVGMATAVVKDMYCIPKINRELAKRAENF